MAADILVVDDLAGYPLISIRHLLEDEGHRTQLARDSDEALKAIEDRRPHLVILDIWFRQLFYGLEVLSVMNCAYPISRS